MLKLFTMNYLYGLLISGLFLGLFIFLIKKKAHGLYFLALGVLPVAAIYLFNTPNFRILSAHGLMHSSLTYQILGGNIPPLNPFLAGGAVIYPWGFHGLVALVSTLTRLAPANLFMLFNLTALALCLLMAYRISNIFVSDRLTNLLSGAAAFYFLSPLPKPFLDLFRNWHQHKATFIYATIPLHKFYHVNSMATGTALLLLSITLALVLFQNQTKEWKPYFYLALSTLALIYVYPLFALPLLIINVGFFFHFAFSRSKKKPSLASLGFIWLICWSAFLAYIFSLIGTNPGSVGLRLHFGSNFFFKTYLFLLPTLPLLLLLIFTRKSWIVHLHVKKELSLYYLAFLLFCFLFYLILPSEQYKFLNLFFLLLGPLAGFAFSSLYQKNKTMGLAALLLFSAPTWGRLISEPWDTSKNSHGFEGQHLRHENWGENELCRWIRENTPKDAVFFDSKLTIPVFGERPLYLAAPQKRIEGFGKEIMHLKGGLAGQPVNLISKRREIQRKIFRGGQRMDESFIKSLREELTKTQGNLYFIARNDNQKKRFAKSSAIHKVFQNSKGAIFKGMNQEEK